MCTYEKKEFNTKDQATTQEKGGTDNNNLQYFRYTDRALLSCMLSA